MSQKIKKIFTNATKLKKITILITLFFVTLGLILPLSSAQAGLEWLPNAIVNFLVSVVFQVLIAISGLFLNLACWILGWVTGPSFISAGFTANPFVTPAWALVRDLANMGFVIALVAIGLGTALRIGEYRAKKTLPLLIFIALLINFTPVICGVIIDASNIAMNFFLEGGIGFEGIKTTFLTQSSILWGGIKETNFFEKLGTGIAMLAYNIIAGFIFLLFAVLFAARYVALWILVILSPLAFFSYVLPATRKFWKTWWNQFIQWTLIGVTAGFWLYLAEQIMMVRLTGSTPPSEEFGGLSAIFAYTIPIIFLGMGLVASLSITATGTEAIIGGAKKVEGWAKQKGKAWVGERVAGVREAAAKSEGVRRAAGWLAKRPAVGAEMKGVGGMAVRATAGTFLEFGRRLGRTGLGLQEVERKEIDTAEKEVEKASVDMVISKFRSTRVWAKKIGYINRLAKQGDIDEALDKGLKEAEIEPVRVEAEKYGAHKEIESALPHREARRMQEHAAGKQISVVQAYIDRIIKGMKPARAGQISRKTFTRSKGTHQPSGTDEFENPEVMEAIVKAWVGSQVSKFIDTHRGEGMKAIEDRIKQLATDAKKSEADWLEANNPRLLKYIRGTAGQGLGFFTI